MMIKKCPKCNTWYDEKDGCHQCLIYERIDNGLCIICGYELDPHSDDEMCRECRKQADYDWEMDCKRKEEMIEECQEWEE